MRRNDLLEKGKNLIVIRDSDKEALLSGWARFLQDNYQCYNIKNGFVCNISKRK